jgi:hypothetical protein
VKLAVVAKVDLDLLAGIRENVDVRSAAPHRFDERRLEEIDEGRAADFRLQRLLVDERASGSIVARSEIVCEGAVADAVEILIPLRECLGDESVDFRF